MKRYGVLIFRGDHFTLTITVQETELVVDLNGIFLCRYRHRIPPGKIDGLRLICVQGSLQIGSPVHLGIRKSYLNKQANSFSRKDSKLLKP